VRRVERFLALRPGDRCLFVQALAAVPFVRVLLSRLGFSRCRTILRLLSFPQAGAVQGPDAVRVASLVRAASHHGGCGRHCLTESLTVWWLLRRRGIESEIQIGVRKDGPGLDAHAWVESAGAVLDEQPDVARTFAPLVRSTVE
jgi:hypothetical protein